MRKKARALGLAAVLFVHGCATYNALEGAKPPEEEPAFLSVPMIKEYWGIGGASLRIYRVDDEYMGNPRHFGALSVNNAILQPGKHTIGVRYNYAAWCGYSGCVTKKGRSLNISFDAEPGHRYRANVEREEDRYWIWIEDEVTGELVAGERRDDELERAATLPTGAKATNAAPITQYIRRAR